MLNTVTTKQIQKDYRKIFDAVKQTDTPVIVINRSKPDVAIISINLLDKMQKTIESTKKEPTTSTGALMRLAGIVKDGLPSDLSQKIDEYVWNK